MPDLSVEVQDRDIVISKPSAGFTITYRKVGDTPFLEALAPIRDNLNSEELIFLVRAWKATFERAKSLGWLS